MARLSSPTFLLGNKTRWHPQTPRGSSDAHSVGGWGSVQLHPPTPAYARPRCLSHFTARSSAGISSRTWGSLSKDGRQARAWSGGARVCSAPRLRAVTRGVHSSSVLLIILRGSKMQKTIEFVFLFLNTVYNIIFCTLYIRICN